jgi:hypothetical protein
MLVHKAAKVNPVLLKQYFMCASKHKFHAKAMAPAAIEKITSAGILSKHDI